MHLYCRQCVLRCEPVRRNAWRQSSTAGLCSERACPRRTGVRASKAASICRFDRSPRCMNALSSGRWCMVMRLDGTAPWAPQGLDLLPLAGPRQISPPRLRISRSSCTTTKCGTFATCAPYWASPKWPAPRSTSAPRSRSWLTQQRVGVSADPGCSQALRASRHRHMWLCCKVCNCRVSTACLFLHCLLALCSTLFIRCRVMSPGVALTPPFSAYNDDYSFLLSAFLLEDVGVTAYGGALSGLVTPAYILVSDGPFHSGL